MKNFILICVLFLPINIAYAQNLIAKNGHISFYSHTPIEDIESHNRQVVSILDPVTGSIQFNLLIKSFEFEKKLMQEHFNENYMESNIHPKASFKGKITNMNAVNFSKDGTYNALVSGMITIHGVSRPLNISSTLVVKNGKVSATAKFIAAPKDFNITIPKVVEENIAKEIEVRVEISYE